jgi:putative iron-regulated protein
MLSLFVVAALALVACGDDEPDDASTGDEPIADDAGLASSDLAADVVAHYADGVHAAYAASLGSATAMDGAIDAFLDDPTEQTLAAARDAWLVARDDYGVTEAFRFYGGPIDDEDGPEGLLNAWPMDEAYVDYVEGDPDAGIVNDPETYPTIDADLLVSLNEEGGEANISTGWHAVEFLLWSQDLSVDGPGARPVSDYTDAPNADRRSTYLATVSDLLLEHLGGLVDEWDPEAGANFHADFVDDPTEESLSETFVGIGFLSGDELAGERMAVAFEDRSQEDEHSCFSDNTHNDIVANARGVEMVWTGAYPGGVEGPGLDELVAESDGDLAAQLTAEIETSVGDAEDIPAPFDQHLLDDAADDGPGRTAVATTIADLHAQRDSIVAAAEVVGLSVDIP